MARSIGDWARDSSLYFRLRDSVIEMGRGKKRWGDRAKYVFIRLAPIREADFPEGFQSGIALIQELHQLSISDDGHSTLLVPSVLTPRQRNVFFDALFGMYEEMTKARARLPCLDSSVHPANLLA